MCKIHDVASGKEQWTSVRHVEFSRMSVVFVRRWVLGICIAAGVIIIIAFSRSKVSKEILFLVYMPTDFKWLFQISSVCLTELFDVRLRNSCPRILLRCLRRLFWKCSISLITFEPNLLCLQSNGIILITSHDLYSTLKYSNFDISLLSQQQRHEYFLQIEHDKKKQQNKLKQQASHSLKEK